MISIRVVGPGRIPAHTRPGWTWCRWAGRVCGAAGFRVSLGERGRFGAAARWTRLPVGLDGRVRGTVPCRRL